MKGLKFVFMAAAAFVGLASAFAGSNRVTFTYANVANNGTFQKVAYNPLKCITVVTRPCAYISPVDLGATATTATLLAASATPTAAKAIYHP